MRTSHSGLMALLVAACAPVAIVLARPGGTTPCYKQTWYMVVQGGDCGTLWWECPGRVLCGPGEVNKDPQPITTAIVGCNDYIGGWTNPATGRCTGGTLILPPSQYVYVAYQDCLNAC